MKVGGPRQGKEILLVLSEDTLRPSCLRGIATSSVKMPPPGTSSLLTDKVSLLMSQQGRGETEQAAAYCWPRQECL